MYKVVRRIEFCYGHRLMDYVGKCARPHGHNAVLEIELESTQLDRRGMVLDFGEIKDQLGTFIESELDHQMLLRQDDPLVAALQGVGESAYLMPVNPTAENIARLVFEKGREMGLPISSVRLWENRDSFAEYHDGIVCEAAETLEFESESRP